MMEEGSERIWRGELQNHRLWVCHSHCKHEFTAAVLSTQGLHKTGLFNKPSQHSPCWTATPDRFLEIGSHCLWMFARWWAYQAAEDSPKAMVAQMALVKFSESKNNTKGQDCGKGFAKRSGIGKGGRETGMFGMESNYNVLYTWIKFSKNKFS